MEYSAKAYQYAREAHQKSANSASGAGKAAPAKSAK
jgi:hypothetical protein